MPTSSVSLISVTVPLENALNGLPWLKTIRSKSGLGLSSVIMICQQGTDVVVECLVDPPPESASSKQQRVQLEPLEGGGDEQIFAADFHALNAGLQQMRMRVYPYNPLLSHRFEIGLMIWL